MACLALSALVLSAQLVPAGSEIDVSLTDVVHAEVDAGTVLGWSSEGVRWKAPEVCASAPVRLLIQKKDAVEVVLPLEVVPSAGAGTGIAITAGTALDRLELQTDAPGRRGFGVSIGAVERSVTEAGCLRAEWKLPPSRGPDFAVAAAFEGSRLVAWSVHARSARGALVVRAQSGSRVSARIGTRLFETVADTDHRARFEIVAPPGTRFATVMSEEGTVREIDLDPRPVTTDHLVVDPDGELWVFRIDRSGAPRDGTPPSGSRWISTGVFRWNRPLASVALPSMALPVRAPPPLSLWTIGPALRIGPAFRVGAGATLRRHLASVELAQVSVGAALVGTDVQQELTGRSGVAHKTIASFPAWVEAIQPVHLGALGLVPSLGFGASAAWRRIGGDFEPASHRFTAGPLFTIGLAAAQGPLDLEVRGIAVLYEKPIESSPWSVLTSIGLRWGRP